LIHIDDLPRKIDFEGANNFRDLGGYPVAGNRRVRPGLLFRSDHLAKLTDLDQDKLAELGISTVVDLRRESERTEAMDEIRDPAIRQVWLPVTAEGADVVNLRRGIEDGSLDYAAARNYLIQANEQYVRRFSTVFRAFMQLLLDPANYPLVFHCSAGKDRAGFAAAMTLYAIGASSETVMHDYLATNHCTANYLNGMLASLADQPAMRPIIDTVHMLMQVHPDFIGTALRAIEEDFASMDEYLEVALAMGRAQRRQLAQILCS
jgi:protein-tyrosine phosphatase